MRKQIFIDKNKYVVLIIDLDKRKYNIQNKENANDLISAKLEELKILKFEEE